jgi:hypothetical protein
MEILLSRNWLRNSVAGGHIEGFLFARDMA